MAVLILILLFVLFQRGSPQSPEANREAFEECLRLYCLTETNQTHIPDTKLSKYCEPIKEHTCVKGSDEEIYFEGAGGGFYSSHIISSFSHGPDFWRDPNSSLCKNFRNTAADTFNFALSDICSCTVNGNNYYSLNNVGATQRCQHIHNEDYEVSFGLLTAALFFQEHKELNTPCRSGGDNFGECISSSKGGERNSFLIIIIITPTISATIILGTMLLYICSCLRRSRARRRFEAMLKVDYEITNVESLHFSFSIIEEATSKFSLANKLGRGGFGEVYKGTLLNGQEIAVKRLSRNSAQGTEEFKNEVLSLAKLQHRNLVRLLGFCLEGDEKILFYEYVPNRSLDFFLFDPSVEPKLDWTMRHKIIGGIARGIMYLHEDSRLRIIHRDLKSANILLDGDMNPKIADFGTARLFGVDQTEGCTNRIAGTYGYMSPEYGMHGQFSVKSDVYSFGVVVLEIITGKRNSSFYHTEGSENLVSCVWKHWQKGRHAEAFDPSITRTCLANEVLRCMHIGLLCVQEDPAQKPTMTTVVLMLNSNVFDLPLPKRPAFFIRGMTEMSMSTEGIGQTNQSNRKLVHHSVDALPITVVSPR